MADRYWVGGTGTWDGTDTTHWSATSGGAGGASVPTTSDDVYLDANSGVVTVTGTGAGISACKTMTCTGFTGTLTGSVLTRGNVTLAATMVATGLTLRMESASGVLTSAGRTLTQLTLDGAGATYTLGDALSVSGTLTLTSGSFTTNNFSVTCGTFSSNNTNTRTLTLGSSSVTITGGAVNSLLMNALGASLTVTANTATVTMTGASPAPNTLASSGTGNMNGASLVLTPSVNASILNSAVWANVTFTGPANKTSSFTMSGGSLAVTSTLTINGNSATNRALVNSNTVGSARTITAATVVASNVDFMDITGAGAADWNLSAISGGSGDAGGNSGITFTPSVTRYAVAAGNWSSTAMWSTASGGAGGASVPLPQDDVVLDANSAAGTYTADMPRLGRALTCTGFTRTLSLTSTTNTVLGSVTLSSGMTLTQTQTFVFAGRSSLTVTSAGKQWGAAVRFDGPGGSYAAQDALNVNGSIPINSGFVSNGFAVTSNGSISSTTATYTRTIDFGSSTVTFTGTTGFPFNFTATTGLTLLTASATLVLSATSASSRTIVAVPGQTFGTITYTVAASTGALILSNFYTVGTLNISGGARTLTLPASATTTVSTWNVFGTAGNLVTVNSSSSGTAATLAKGGGGLSTSDYLSIQDIAATGGNWIAGANSTNVSGNSGWAFDSGNRRYWVGGSATWDATAGSKWSSISGGVGGMAAPTSSDDVYFDGNSGSGTVTVAAGGVAVAKSLTCTGFIGALNGAPGTLTVSGSVALSASMSTSSLSLSITPSAPATITSAGKSLSAVTITAAGASVTLGDAFSCSALTLTSGTFDTANFAVTCGTFSSSNSNTRTLTLGSSSITLTGTGGNTWNAGVPTGLTVTANTATATFTGTASSAALMVGTGGNWNGLSVVFSGAGQPMISLNNGIIANLTRTGTTSKTDALLFGNGITITGTLTLTGNSATNRVLVQSSTLGTARTITAAAVSASNVDFMDIVGAGAASWNLSAITGGSGDAGGNSGITFTPGETNYWVGGTGNWSDVNHWASTSGGVGGTGRVPLPQGTARFDANSFTAGGQVVTADMPRAAGDIDWTGVTNTPAWTPGLAGSPQVFGSLTLAAVMTLPIGTGGVQFWGRGSHTLTTAGRIFPNSVTFSGFGGTYTLNGALTDTANVTVTAGSLVTNGYAVTCLAFNSTGSLARTVDLSTSTVTVTGTSGTVWNATSTGLTQISAAATLVLGVATSSTRTVNGLSATWGAIVYTVPASTGALSLGPMTVGTLSVRGGARTLTLVNAQTVTVTNFDVFGTAGNLITVNSSTPGSAATLVKGDANPTVSGYLSIQDIAATPGSTWYAGATSTDVSGNSGWIFTDMPVGRQVATRWVLTQKVATNRQAVWATRAVTSNSLSARWVLTSVIAKQLDTRWALTEIVAKNVSVSWDVAVPSARLKVYVAGVGLRTGVLRWWNGSAWVVKQLNRPSNGAWIPVQLGED